MPWQDDFHVLHLSGFDPMFVFMILKPLLSLIHSERYSIMMSETTNSSGAQSATICLSDNCIEILDASHALTSYVDEELLLSSARFRVL